jgi:hypothetical protein
MHFPWTLRRADPARRRYLAAATVILLAAAFMRFIQIDTVPPGPFYDDAANGLIARDIAYHGARPVFTLAFTGREPLFHYVTALLMRLAGNDLLALRLASFYLGMVVVAGMLGLGRAYFRGQPRERLLALIVGALTATTFWPISNARFGMRAISFTFTVTLLLWSLARLWRRGRLEDAAWVGVWAAATAYTYTANRIVPFALGAALLWLLARKQKRLTWRHAVVLGGVSLLLFAPMGAFLLRHPEIITHRAAQVSTLQPGMSAGVMLSTAAQGMLHALGAFGFEGDPLLYLNVPGRPVFDPFWAACFYLGLAYTVFAALRHSERAPLAGAIVIWLGIMLLPGALTIEPFHSLRSLGALPIAMLLPAAGFGLILILVERRVRLPDWLPGALAALLVTTAALGTYRAYFIQWGQNPELYSLRDGDMADLGRWFNSHDTGDAPIYIISYHYEHPTMAFIASSYGRMKWASLGQTVVFPLPDQEAYIGIPQSGLVNQDWVLAQLAGADLLDGPTWPDGKPKYLVYHVTPGSARPQPENLQAINFANSVRLIGYDPALSEGDQVIVTLYWEILGQPAIQDFGLVAHLADEWGQEWVRRGVFNYPPDQWEAGEMIVHQLKFDRPVGLPPGEYTVELEWFSQSTGLRLPVVRQDGGFGGVYGVMGPITVEAAIPTTTDVEVGQVQLDQAFGPLTLLGFDLDTPTVYAGDILRLALHWQADRPIEDDHRIQLSLIGSDGTTVPLSDAPPVHGTYPTSRWSAGEVVTDRYTIRLDPGLSEDEYEVVVSVEGFDEAIPLGSVQVEGSDRLFEPPALTTDQTAAFGDVVRLLGYDLDYQPGDESATIRFGWQAIQPPEDSYSVFVHVVDGDGEIVAQHDGLPRGDYPLYRWVSGEVVLDEVTLPLPYDLPAGEYRIRVGFYRPETGERLPVEESSREAGADFIWLEDLIVVGPE